MSSQLEFPSPASIPFLEQSIALFFWRVKSWCSQCPSVRYLIRHHNHIIQTNIGACSVLPFWVELWALCLSARSPRPVFNHWSTCLRRTSQHMFRSLWRLTMLPMENVEDFHSLYYSRGTTIDLKIMGATFLHFLILCQTWITFSFLLYLWSLDRPIIVKVLYK